MRNWKDCTVCQGLGAIFDSDGNRMGGCEVSPPTEQDWKQADDAYYEMDPRTVELRQALAAAVKAQVDAEIKLATIRQALE